MIMRSKRKIDKNFVTLCLCKFMIAFGNFVVTFLSFFLISFKKLDSDIAGVLISIISISYIPAILVGGKLIHKDSKKLLSVLFFTAGICYSLVFLFDKFLGVQLILIFIGKFLVTVTDPVINNCINGLKDNNEGKKDAFSTIYMFTNLGFAFGPLFAGLLYQKHVYLIFALDGMLKILVAFLIYTSYNVSSKAISVDNKKGGAGTYIGLLKEYSCVILISMFFLVFNFTYSQNEFLLTYHMEKLFSNRGSLIYGYLMSVNAITIILFTKIINRLTIRLSTFTAIFISGLMFAVGFGSYAVTSHVVTLCMGTFVWSIGEILFYTNMSVCINDLVSECNFGLAYSLINTISRIGMILSPAVMGLLLNYFSTGKLWILVSIFMITDSVLLLMWRLVKRSKDNGR